MKTTESKRCRQLGELIQHKLAQIILVHREQPIFTRVTLVAVEVAPDLATAKIFFSLFDENEAKEARRVLKDSAKFLRHELAQQLNLRRTPALHFIYDESIIRGQKLSALIDAAVARDTQESQESDENNEA